MKSLSPPPLYRFGKVNLCNGETEEKKRRADAGSLLSVFSKLWILTRRAVADAA